MKKPLSARQLQVMEKLWEMPEGMTASAIVRSDEQLQINTVQQALRSLVAKNYIKVGEIVYSGTVLSRSYVPVVSREEYLQMSCRQLARLSASSALLANLIREEDDADRLDELEAMIRERRKELDQKHGKS